MEPGRLYQEYMDFHGVARTWRLYLPLVQHRSASDPSLFKDNKENSLSLSRSRDNIKVLELELVLLAVEGWGVNGFGGEEEDGELVGVGISGGVGVVVRGDSCVGCGRSSGNEGSGGIEMWHWCKLWLGGGNKGVVVVMVSLAPKFLRLNSPKVEVNATNTNHETALDIFLQLPKENQNEEIKDILGRAKAVVRDCPMEVRNALLVVAVLTAAATIFQTGVNPPGGVCQDNYHPDDENSDKNSTTTPKYKEHRAGNAIMATHMWGLSIFTICNLAGFLISYAMIILLTHGFPLRSLLLLALHSMVLTYMISLCIISPLRDEEYIYIVIPAIGFGLIIICLLSIGVVFIHCGRKKKAVEHSR
ncbi:hypothetical protein HHK36_000892 [Tetracentron sinense]|uniref:PGG domain-containing protein n=1 Tax=Tetracentron sinense TaxID=13715 RepID=A0A834ZWA3_TETSI|nr:hypothetical protein HHK36_000892 [Tetracentron sinense]